MKVLTNIIFVALLLVGNNVCSAQEISIRGGLNLSQFNYKSGNEVIHYDGVKLNPGFNIGTIIEIPLKKIFSVESGMIITSKGHKISGDIMGVENYLVKKNLFYLEIPALFKATFPVKNTNIFLASGPYTGCALFGYNLAEGDVNSKTERLKNNIQWGSEQNEYDRFDYGFSFGTGVKVHRYQIGVSYELGLKDFSNYDKFEIRNRVLIFYLAYKFETSKKNNNNSNNKQN